MMKIWVTFCITLDVAFSELSTYHPFDGLPGFTRNFEHVEPVYFKYALKSNGFVDKSLLIKELMTDENKYVLITCPKMFGKSVNLEMVRRFLEIIVDVNDEEILDGNLTKNYYLFTNPWWDFKIAKDKDFMDKHFGKYPVIHMKNTPFGLNKYSILLSIKMMLTRSFSSYDYLPKLIKKKYGDTLTEYELDSLKLFQKIADHGIEEDEIEIYVTNLVENVYKYFGKKAIILIDDFDSAISLVINRGYDEYLKEVADVMNSILTTLVNARQYVERVIMTGLSRMYVASDTYRTKGVKYYDFLDDHRYAEYFGFTNEEVEGLFKKNGVQRTDEEDQVEKYFDGFEIRNRDVSLYVPSLTSNYFKTRFILLHRESNVTIGSSQSVKFLRYENIFIALVDVLTRKTISFELIRNATVEDLILYTKMVNGSVNATEKFRMNFCLTHLFERGYFSYTTMENIFKIPNKEIEDELINAILVHFRDNGVTCQNPKVLTNMHQILLKKQDELKKTYSLTHTQPTTSTIQSTVDETPVFIKI